MRISPLGVFCRNYDLEQTANFAEQDARLTHPHPICVQANALFTMAIATAVGQWKPAETVYADVKIWAQEMKVEPILMKAIVDAADGKPEDFITQQGWVLVAFQNALWQLLHAQSLEEGVIDTVMSGGDTDTNAAIAGALLGAVYSRKAIPAQWEKKILNCKPKAGLPNIRQPRPECFWAVDVLHLAHCLVAGGEVALPSTWQHRLEER